MSNKTSDNSVANIEENIKTIKNLLQMLENGFLTEEMCPIRSWDPTPKHASALKYILAEREQDKKRIKELEEEKVELKEYNKIVSDRIVEYKKNSIPKQVVIDKVNEINKKYEDSKDENGESPYFYPDFTIRILQKLLEGEK